MNRWTRTVCTARRDRGSVTLELTILTPVMLLLLAFVVLVGRVTLASAAVTSIAGNAAREASLARNPGAATAAATTSARTALAAQQLHCQDGGTVTVDTSGFATAARGSPGQAVAVTVTCLVALSDLAIPGLPGNRTITDHGVSPLDPHRGTGSSP